MAGIEKVSEYSGEYPGWAMYGYKLNHIQILPSERKHFAKQPHTLVIFKPNEYRHYLGKNCYSSITIDRLQNCTMHEYEKIGGKWYEWTGKRHSDREFATLVGFVPEYQYCLYVPSLPGQVDGEYWNYSANIGTVKRKLKRMLKCKKLVVKYVDMTAPEFYNNYESITQLLGHNHVI